MNLPERCQQLSWHWHNLRYCQTPYLPHIWTGSFYRRKFPYGSIIIGAKSAKKRPFGNTRANGEKTCSPCPSGAVSINLVTPASGNSAESGLGIGSCVHCKAGHYSSIPALTGYDALNNINDRDSPPRKQATSIDELNSLVFDP